MRNTSKKEVLSEFLSNRNTLIELIIVAIIIGIGIEFLSSSLFDIIAPNYKNLLFLLLGTLMCLSALVFFFVKFFGVKNIQKEIKGFFIINKESNEIVSIDNYDFASHLKRNIEAAILEDMAIKIDWEDSSFKYDSTVEKRERGMKIINEMVEYFILETISTHLSYFFNRDDIDKSKLVKLSRNDIPSSILLSNQFLELFSKPMEQRAAFKTEKKPENKNKDKTGKIVACYSNGAIYQHFDLILPKDSTIDKDKNGYIVVATKRFILKYKSKFVGFNTNCPIKYEEYYLGLTDFRRYSTFQIDIDFEFNLKFGALLKQSGWDIYNWVDSLLETLDKKISKREYFEKINWNKAYVIIKSLKKDSSKTQQIQTHYTARIDEN
jgi:hypothetical protein